MSLLLHRKKLFTFILFSICHALIGDERKFDESYFVWHKPFEISLIWKSTTAKIKYIKRFLDELNLSFSKYKCFCEPKWWYIYKLYNQSYVISLQETTFARRKLLGKILIHRRLMILDLYTTQLIHSLFLFWKRFYLVLTNSFKRVVKMVIFFGAYCTSNISYIHSTFKNEWSCFNYYLPLSSYVAWVMKMYYSIKPFLLSW